jgi:hypothetical protein
MDLAMVKQEQGKTLRKYMRRFFDKRATVVDVSDKEVIDLFQDGLYHRRTFVRGTVPDPRARQRFAQGVPGLAV